jgi:hypothetical protein
MTMLSLDNLSLSKYQRCSIIISNLTMSFSFSDFDDQRLFQINQEGPLEAADRMAHPSTYCPL